MQRYTTWRGAKIDLLILPPDGDCALPHSAHRIGTCPGAWSQSAEQGRRKREHRELKADIWTCTRGHNREVGARESHESHEKRVVVECVEVAVEVEASLEYILLSQWIYASIAIKMAILVVFAKIDQFRLLFVLFVELFFTIKNLRIIGFYLTLLR